MPTIKKLALKNFKSFNDLTLSFDSGINVIIGDNEVRALSHDSCAKIRPRPDDGSVLIYDTAADAFFSSVVAHALTTRTRIAMGITPLRRVGCIECFAPCVFN